MTDDVQNKILSTLDAIQSDIGVLKSDVGTLKSDVGTLKSDVVSIKQILAKHDDQFDQLFNAVKENRNKLDDHETLLNTLLSRSVDHETKLLEHDANFDRLFIGQDKTMLHLDGIAGAIKKNTGEIAALGMGRDRHEERLDKLETIVRIT